jgi:hypothetical protein
MVNPLEPKRTLKDVVKIRPIQSTNSFLIFRFSNRFFVEQQMGVHGYELKF